MRTILAAAAAFTLLGFAPARADAPEAGELWETTAQASVPGVPVTMKPYTTKICQKKEWTQPPQTDPDSGGNCKTTDFSLWRKSPYSPPGPSLG